MKLLESFCKTHTWGKVDIYSDGMEVLFLFFISISATFLCTKKQDMFLKAELYIWEKKNIFVFTFYMIFSHGKIFHQTKDWASKTWISNQERCKYNLSEFVQVQPVFDIKPISVMSQRKQKAGLFILTSAFGLFITGIIKQIK